MPGRRTTCPTFTHTNSAPVQRNAKTSLVVAETPSEESMARYSAPSVCISGSDGSACLLKVVEAENIRIWPHHDTKA